MCDTINNRHVDLSIFSRNRIDATKHTILFLLQPNKNNRTTTKLYRPYVNGHIILYDCIKHINNRFSN